MNDNPVFASLLLCLLVSFAFAGLLLALVVIASINKPFSRLLKRYSSILQRPYDRIGNHPVAAVVILFAAAIFVCAVFCYKVDDPVPGVHDEFSYLLAADTFARGRLTNPTHPLWEHFETFHVLQQPTYASKYPPAQGLALALGQVLTGWPVVGAWISIGVASAAIYWMLRSVVPGRWAFLGGLLCLLHPLMVRWGTNYWGGGIATIGGALVLGAAIRISRRTSSRSLVRQGAIFGLGLVLLANSRPFEGAIFGILCALLALRKHHPLRIPKVRKQQSIMPAVLAAMVPLFLAGIWMGFYNRAVTGSFLRMPYMEYTAQYDSRPIFLWQRLKPIHSYRTPDLAQFYANDQTEHRNQSADVRSILVTLRSKAVAALLFLFWQPALLFGAAIIFITAFMVRSGKFWVPYVMVFTAYIPAILISSYMFPHYAAPSVGLMILLGLVGLRYLSALGKRFTALRLVPWIFLPLLMIGTLTADGVTRFQSAHSSQGRTWKYRRIEVERRLLAQGGKHVLIVQYGPKHLSNFSWVNNGANIDTASVVWARDLGPSRNQDLLSHFKGYQFHLVYVNEDAAIPQISDYPNKVSTLR